MKLIDALKESRYFVKRTSWSNWAMDKEGNEMTYNEAESKWQKTGEPISLSFADAIASDWNAFDYR